LSNFVVELLVKFFERALLSLVPKGSIIVTLFEGHPYTLWNIRDLARHSGLAVEKSFKFQSKAYPGYHHARTVGAIKNKQGELGGGWKGEERAARSFIFMRKGEETAQGAGSKRKIEESEEASKEDDAELYGSDEEPEILSGEAENEDD
jgi:25S rRNA (uracil2634-N3)-methyltransferase